MARIIAILLAVMVTPIWAQPVLEVEVEDDLGVLHWTSSPDPSSFILTMRLRLTGTSGGWGTIVTGCSLPGEHPYFWLDPANIEESVEVPYWGQNNMASGVGVPSQVFTLLANLGLQTYYMAGPSEMAVKNWYVPFLASPTGTITRVWSAWPDIWVNPQLSTTLSLAQSALCESQTAEFGGTVTDPELMSLEGMARHAIVVQSLLGTGSLQAANEFFDSMDYADAISGGQISIHIQGITAQSGSPSITPGESDGTAPGLFGIPIDLPLTSVTEALPLPVRMPAPATTGILGLGGSLQPGHWIRFTGRFLTPPVTVGFPGPGGIQIPARAYSDVTRNNALQYKVQIPEGILLGDIHMQTGLHPTPFVAGQVTEVVPPSPTPNP
jgi:hypothetical protein